MGKSGWSYYNHALIPTCAPDETPDTSALKNRELWKSFGGTPILARWTTDWDCGDETDWWYIICTPPFSLSGLSKSSRKNIRKALENCDVRRIDPAAYAEELWQVFNEAAQRYANHEANADKDRFIAQCRNAAPNMEYWAGFDKNTDRMIGYKICAVFDHYVGFSVSKYSSGFLKLRVSDALNYTVIDHYFSRGGIAYISNGERSIIHKTNVQQYYQEHFGFRKAYCHLNIVYNKGFGFIIRLLYPFRRLVKTDSILTNKIAGVLKMEEIRRNQIKHDVG